MLTNPWIIRPAPRPAPQVRLLAFPYAGGGAAIYQRWAAQLPDEVELVAVQLPGRQNRFVEPAFTAMPALLTALDTALAPLFDRPVAFFGHSLGALIAFELARLRRRNGATLPVGLFVSGHRAPQLVMQHTPIHHLSDSAFVAGVMRLNGTPPEIAQHAELLDLMLPTLRADFTLAETYNYRPEAPLSCPLTAFGGQDDPQISADQIAAWAAQTTGPFRAQMLPGDHFFVNTAQPALLAEVQADLARWLPAAR